MRGESPGAVPAFPRAVRERPSRPNASAPAPTHTLGVPPIILAVVILDGAAAAIRTGRVTKLIGKRLVGVIGDLGNMFGSGAFFGVDGEHGYLRKLLRRL